MTPIYLDYAAATPMRDEVLEAMRPYFTDKFHNPGATYLAARNVRLELAGWRARAAEILGCRPAEIFFTAGATEANNLAIQGTLRQFAGARVAASTIEHSSVLQPVRRFKHRLITVDGQGRLDLADLENSIDDKTVLVSVMHINNEIGVVQPLAEISRILDKLSISRRRKSNGTPLYFHSDAAQSANYLDLHVSRLGVDMLSLNGDKLYGPKGSGILYVKAGTRLQPLVWGGGQELGLRSGTENLATIAGLVTALELAQKEHEHEARRLTKLRQDFESKLRSLGDFVVVNGGSRRAPHLVSVTLKGHDNEVVMMRLDEAGIQVAVGSACSAAQGEPSHVLSAIGLDEKASRATIRISLGRGTSAEQLDKTVTTLSKILKA